MKVATNLQSLQASNQLSETTKSLSVQFKRLSSGLRLNSASDDAAGLSISVRMNSQVRGIQTAQRNANDFISLFQTAEGGLGEIESNLQRMRELAIQSASETYNAHDRQAIQAEIIQLKDQIQNIATTTQFNHIKLLDGTMLQQLAQIGHGAESQELVSIHNAKTSHIGHHNRIDSLVGVFVSRIHDFTIRDLGGGDKSLTFVVEQADGSTENIGARATTEADDLISSHVLDSDDITIDVLGSEQLRMSSAIAKAKTINANTDATGIRAIVGKTRTDHDYANVPNLDALGRPVFTDIITGDLVLGNSNAIQATILDHDNVMYINGVGISGFSILDNDADGTLIRAINEEFEDTGVVASLDANSQLVLEAEDGRNIVVQYRHADGTRNTDLMDEIGLLDGADGDFAYGGNISLISDEGFTIENFADPFDPFVNTNDALGVLSDALDPDTGESVFLADLEQFFFKNDVVIADVDVSTVDLTERSIITLDYAINQVSESRSELGAQINRFESTMRSLKIEEENLQSAVSQIQDTDVALEVSTLTQNQIIQQAATSVLAQANSQSNIVLALL